MHKVTVWLEGHYSEMRVCPGTVDGNRAGGGDGGQASTYRPYTPTIQNEAVIYLEEWKRLYAETPLNHTKC